LGDGAPPVQVTCYEEAVVKHEAILNHADHHRFWKKVQQMFEVESGG